MDDALILVFAESPSHFELWLTVRPGDDAVAPVENFVYANLGNVIGRRFDGLRCLARAKCDELLFHATLSAFDEGPCIDLLHDFYNSQHVAEVMA